MATLRNNDRKREATPVPATPLNPLQLEVIRDILFRDSYLVQRWDEITSCSPNSLSRHSPQSQPRRQQQRPTSRDAATMKQMILKTLQVWRTLVGQSANLDCLIALLKSRGVRIAAEELIRKREWIQSIGQPKTPKISATPLHLRLQEKKSNLKSLDMNVTNASTATINGSPSPEVHYLHPDSAGGSGYGWQQRHNSADSGIVDPSAVEEDDDDDENDEMATATATSTETKANV